MWSHISEIFDRHLGIYFFSIGQLWISNRIFLVCNIFCAAALWGLWKLRNNLCFQVLKWRDMNYLLLRIATMLQGWTLFMSHEAETFFCYKPKYAAVDGYTASKDWWLNLVPDEADRLMFQRAHRWEEGTPKELEPFLSKDVDEAWRL